MGSSDDFFYGMYWTECWDEAEKQMRAEQQQALHQTSEETNKVKLEIADSSALREKGIMGVTAEHHADYPGQVIVRGELQPKKVAEPSISGNSASLTFTIYNSEHEVIGTSSEDIPSSKRAEHYPFEVYVTCSESHGMPHSARVSGTWNSE